MLGLPRRILSAAVIAATSLCAQSHSVAVPSEPHIEAIRFWSFGDLTRIAIETKGEYQVSSDHLDSPPRLFFDLRGLRPPASGQRGIRVFHVGDRLVRQIRVAETEPGVSRVVFDLEVPSDFTSSQLINPDRLMIEVRSRRGTAPDTLTTRSYTGVRKASEAPVTGSTVDDTSKSDRAGLPMPAIPLTDLFADSSLKLEMEDDSPLPKSTLIWNGRNQTSAPSATIVAAPTPGRPRTRTPDRRPAPLVATETTAIQTSTTPAPISTTPIAPDRFSPARIDANRSLVRVFGLKIHKVVIDAGHGGHDTGTIGPKGLMEKDLVLDVALRLGKLVQQRLGAEVVFTRANDTFIPLEQRTKIANEEKADLFISIHANSSPASAATGVETYYFNFTSDQHSLDLATRENASSTSSIFQLNDLLHKAVLNAKVEESREFAQKVQNSLFTMSAKMNNTSRDRGVKKAPFVVLIGATMPSILAEVGFVSNPKDERLLKREDQRQKIAESLFKGVSVYATTLSHVQLARAAGEKD